MSERPSQSSNSNSNSNSGGGGFRRRNFRSRFTRRKKSCSKKVDFTYLKPETLRPYMTSHGRIKPMRLNRMCAKHQRKLAREIKRARHLALLPFVVD